MAISIKDVAKEANVSIATVSRVLNDVDVVNLETKQKVKEAIKKLGYRPNIIARSLKTQRTSTIGILIPDISNPVYPEIVRGTEDVANIYNYNIILCNSDQDKDKEIEYLRVLREKMVDGLVYMSSSLDPQIVEVIKELQIPTVLLETVDKNKTFPSVTIDNKEATYDAVMTMLNRGNKKIAYIGLHKDALNAVAQRYYGYEDALKEKGIALDERLIEFTEINFEEGYNATRNLISKGKFDAIFCATDEVAMGAIDALRDNGIDVPSDVEVFGFNNIKSSSYFHPKISTVGIPYYDMGSVGMRMLIKIINKKELEEQNYILSYNIIERDSTKNK